MISTFFFIFLALFLLAFVAVVANMVLMTKNVMGFNKDTVRDNFNKVGNGFTRHIIAGAATGLFFVATLATGILWLVIHFAA